MLPKMLPNVIICYPMLPNVIMMLSLMLPLTNTNVTIVRKHLNIGLVNPDI